MDDELWKHMEAHALVPAEITRDDNGAVVTGDPVVDRWERELLEEEDEDDGHETD